MASSTPSLAPHLTWNRVPSETFLGIDGARGGWVVAKSELGKISLDLFRSFSSIPLSPTSRALVDMPIGLPERHRRCCDAEARELLGSRRSTIFPVPTRAAVYADSYADCCAINESLQGCKVSKQAWNLFPKMRELDLYMRCDPSRHSQIAEGHPELAFRALTPSLSPLPSKRTPEGEQARRIVLAGLGTHIDALVENFVTSHSKEVDITDAYDALSLCALLSRSQGGVSFLGDGSVDEYGAPERICFA